MYVKSKDATLALSVVIPKRFGVTGVAWSQSPIPMKGSPVSPAPLVLSEPMFVGNVASVRVDGGSPGARYLLSTAPGPFEGGAVPVWVRQFRIEIA